MRAPITRRRCCRGGKILVAGGEGVSGRALSSAELYDPDQRKIFRGRVEDGHRARRAYRDADFRMQLPGRRQGADRGRHHRRKHARLHSKERGTVRSCHRQVHPDRRDEGDARAPFGHADRQRSAGGERADCGRPSDESGGDVATAELYDPVTGQFTTTGRMSTPRENHSATWLSPNVVTGSLAGNVLIAGGGDVSAPSDSAEVFNPQTAAFSPVGAMTTARTLQAAVLLPSGKVLIAGGQSSDTELPRERRAFRSRARDFCRHRLDAQRPRRRDCDRARERQRADRRRPVKLRPTSTTRRPEPSRRPAEWSPTSPNRPRR